MATLFLDSSSKKLYLGIDTCFSEFDLSLGLCEELPACLKEVCTLSGKNVSEISEVVYCNGPGSFTGLRGGLSFCKGLTHLKNIPMYGVSLFLARGYLYLTTSELGDKGELTFYIPANVSEHYICRVNHENRNGKKNIDIDEIKIISVAEHENSSGVLISLREEDLSYNPAYALQRFYNEAIANDPSGSLTNFQSHLASWNSDEIPPTPIYGKGIQAKTLKERGIVLREQS